GQWSHCIGQECGSGGVQSRMTWCVHAEGWTAHHSHCQHMDKPESQRHCFKVCDWHQDLFRWDVSDWGPCALVPFFGNEPAPRTADCITAQHGIQRRSIRCVRTSNTTAVSSRICEFFSQKPLMEQACLIPCPQDCVVSDFTSWSSCSRTCGAGLQHRTRHVLATPMYGGANCPNLTDTRTCSISVNCPAGEAEYQYSLKAGAWSECRLPHQKDLQLSGRTTVDFSTTSSENNTVTIHRQTFKHHHNHHHHHANAHTRHPWFWDQEVGYQTRQVRCTRSDGKNVMLSLCTRDSSSLIVQTCVMPKDCQTSDWSPWSPCSKTCRSADLSPGYRLRSRMVTQIPIGGGKQCPALEEKEACNIIGDLLSNCPRYSPQCTDFLSSTLAQTLADQQTEVANLACCVEVDPDQKTYCVKSVQLDVHHRKEVSRPVNSRLCVSEEPPLAVQNCSVPCKHQCPVSEWSSWSACLFDNCKDAEGKKGFRQRRREVLWESGSHLETCPHLVESIPCEDPTCFLWQIKEEPCIPTSGSCGHGTAIQNVSCVSIEVGEVEPPASCEGEPPPSEVSCDLACAADCVVSHWSHWSPCSHSCATKNSEGRQSRKRTVLALPGKDGKACPAATALEEWRVCNNHPCIVFHWETSAWGLCIENVSIDLNVTSLLDVTSTCPVGIQIRKVKCVKSNSGPVISKRCSDSARPEAIRPCAFPCKRDCVVTPFSEWTACPSTCLPDNATVATQSRYRTIIQRSANGGQECPGTLYEERECDSLPVCPAYRWRTHKWQSCILVPESVQRGLSGQGEACGNGLETRGISCVSESDQSANVTECLRWAGPMPPQIRECRVLCKDDCALTAWSRFTECSGCGSSRSRKRTLTGRSRKKEHCLNVELEQTEPCPCDELLSQPYGNWSACILPDPPAAGALKGWTSEREIKECGQGVRYRAVACVEQQGHLVDPTLCTEMGFVVEVCHIPCPLDCKLSDWSAWSACSASCGSGLQMRSKWLREKAFNRGRPCPRLDLKNQAQVYEAVPCHSDCSQYEWRVESWSICTINAVDDLPACGEGVQSRKIRCVKKGTSDEASGVDAGLCDQEEMPSRAQVCFLACPKDCVTSAWGAWSSCSLPCDSGTSRNRTRQILRLPASPQDSPCPDLVQSEPCVLNSTCFTHEYRVSDWSTCQLSENAVCGEGFRLRLLDCIRSDGKVVEARKCEQLGLVNTWTLSESCVVDCPISCILSDWTPWTECSRTCGSQAFSSRTRRILQEAHEEGRPCPSQLTQTKPCPIRPCYRWLISDWSPCILEGAQCGEGLQRRNLTCVVHWGDRAESASQPVQSEFCGDELLRKIQQEMEKPCFIPCPVMVCYPEDLKTESVCNLQSFVSNEMLRKPAGGPVKRPSKSYLQGSWKNKGSCPHQVYESRPCKGGKCHSYQWRTGGWSNNERVVWCQRSDGVNVTGGCFLQKKPTTVRHCHPPCTKPFSHCTPSGVCGCEKGYTEVMTTHGFLDYCTRTPGVDSSKKADVKTNSGRSKPQPPQGQDLFSEWTLRPIGPDGRVKLWVYAVTAVGFILILFVIALTFLLCTPSRTSKTSSPAPQKPLTLAYDGDIDM
uniref:Thrombospondin type-1 domain-containing protein 7A n=1 Tax=Tetraodon nigroviridis TaxID=99883 RepID=H3D083_TETNG